jgi:hypothetical protein
MTFCFYEYQMPDMISQTIKSPLTEADNPIRLPMPNSMVDAQHVEYSAEGIGLAGAAAVTAAKTAENFNVNNLTGTIANAARAAAYGIGSTAESFLNSTAGRAAGATQGVALNPFLTVLFKSPAFKQHTLSWKLAPSNQAESSILNNIINKFRGNMLPNQSGALGGSLLTYPNIVQVTASGNNDQYFTYKFKPAVVRDISVNFTPQGQPSFFGSTKAPTEVELRVELMEIEYWLSNDYGFQSHGIAKTIDGIQTKLGSIVDYRPGQNWTGDEWQSQRYNEGIQ